MQACSSYIPHPWQKDKCRECFQKKEDHPFDVQTTTSPLVESPPSSDIVQKTSTKRLSKVFSEPDRECPSAGSDNATSITAGATNNSRRLSQGNLSNMTTTSETNKSTISKHHLRRKNSDTKTLTPCWYGIACYRKDPHHFEKYSHPQSITIDLPTPSLPQHEQKIDDASAQMIADLQQQLREQQIAAEKHVRLVEERFRASMIDHKNTFLILEKEIKKLLRERGKMAKYHQQLEQDLAEELDKRERRELEQRQILSIRRDTPSYWGSNAFEIPYREVNISQGSPEFSIVSDLLNDTIETHDNNYGTINGQDPTEFIVTKLFRIQNDKLWHEYCFKKERIIEKNNHRLKDCESSKYLQNHPLLTPLLDSSANEYWLFHGCDARILPHLLHAGYDPRVSDLHGMFGGGFYLAENSSKSNQYIPCPGCGMNSIFTGDGCNCRDQENLVFTIILYRAVVGDVHIAHQYDGKKYRGEGKRRVRRAPLKDNGFDVYDSVLGESTKYGGDRLKYREVILYESGQAYPEYVIEFRRSAANTRAPSDAKRVKDQCYRFLKNTFRIRPE